MMIIPLVILVIFYRGILNGFDESAPFIYFVIFVIISFALYIILPIMDEWKDHRIYIGIIGIILVSSIVFGALSLQELSKVEVNIVNPEMGSTVQAQFVISGLFKNIPENKDIWLYAVNPVNKKYYPEPMPVTKLGRVHSGAGSWDYYGMAGTNRFKGSNKHFQIGIFISNQTDRNYIEQEIRRLKGSSRGMNYLPDGIEDLGIKINVTKI